MSSRSSHPSPFTRATKVIVVADVVESVRLMELGEQDFIGRWHRFVNFAQE
jgi:adenylate cyclase